MDKDTVLADTSAASDWPIGELDGRQEATREHLGVIHLAGQIYGLVP